MSAPDDRGTPLRSRWAILGWIQRRITSIWSDDPQISAVLTPEFVKEFKSEFERMVRERRTGATKTRGQAAILSRMRADSQGTLHHLFDALLKEYPRIDRLEHPLRAQVVIRLMQHCDLLGSGLL
jgi:hypothetical protein